MNAPSLASILSGTLLIAISSAQDAPQPDPRAAPESAPPAATESEDSAESGLGFLARSNAIVAKIKQNDRPVDPFGMPMDPTNPSESQALADQYAEVEEAPVLNGSSLKTALESLPITGIYPHREVLVIGARSFQTGDQFGMELEELTLRLRFEGIKGKSVFFKDMDTQEVASVEFDPKPKEFEPVTASSKRPTGEGIVPMKDLFIVN